jgi:hypothetical protein
MTAGFLPETSRGGGIVARYHGSSIAFARKRFSGSAAAPTRPRETL